MEKTDTVPLKGERLVKTAALVSRLAHKGQTDDAGVPYYEHPRKVAEMLEDPILKAIAYLHDVLEDTAVSEEDLFAVFPRQVAETVILLTHRQEEPYETYIRRIACDPVARKVKMADLTHNMDLSRLKEVTPYARKRLELRYKPAYEYLKGFEEKEREDVS